MTWVPAWPYPGQSILIEIRCIYVVQRLREASSSFDWPDYYRESLGRMSLKETYPSKTMIRRQPELAYRSLLFLHIPKAAGTSLAQVVTRQFQSQSIFKITHPRRNSVRRLKNMMPDERAGIRLLMGHMPFGYHELLRGPQCYVTMLRDPVERVISYFYYVLQTPDHYLFKHVLSNGLDLKGFLESELTNELDNGQTRFISGIGDGSNTPFGGCHRRHLDMAKRNIQEWFAVAGVAELFSETVLAMGLVLGWKQLFYRKSNVTKRRVGKAGVDAATLQIIEQQNRLDIELYRWARSRFEVGIRNQPAFRSLNLIYKTLNKPYGKLQPIARKLWPA